MVFFGASFSKRDIFRFYYPVWQFAVETMKSGVLPLWNPYSGCGTPFFANIQTCVLYPFSAILYLPNYLWAFNFYILLHLTLAGVFCCGWMRECGASKEASFLAGMSYCLGGYVLSAISLTISLATLAYFPLVLLTLRRSLLSNAFFWKFMSGMVLLVQYLAGDPTIFFATLVVMTLLVFYKTVRESFIRRGFFLKFLLDLLKIFSVFFGLSAFHLFLFVEFLMHSDRARMGYDQVTTWSLQYNDLLSIIFPYFSDISLAFMDYWQRQSWMENSYVGITVVLLACLALKGRDKRDIIGYHVLLALLGVGFSLGRFCSVYDIFYYGFPFFRFIRYPVRFLFLLSFALSCLAGFGLDKLLLGREERKTSFLSVSAARRITFLMLFFLILVILSMMYSSEIESKVVAVSRQFFREWAHRDLGKAGIENVVFPVLVNLKRTTVLVCFFLLGILSAWHLKARRLFVTLFFMLIVFVDLIDVNMVEGRLDGAMLNKKLGTNLTRLLEDPGIFRVLASPKTVRMQCYPESDEGLAGMLSDLKETLTPNLLLPHHVADVSGYDSIYLEDIMDIGKERRNIKSPTQCRLYDMMNIRYVVSPQKEIGEGYERLEETRLVNLFLNHHSLPRAYLVPQAKVLKDRQSILKMIASPGFDPENTVYLEKSTPILDSPETGGISDVSIEEYTPNHSKMKVHSGKNQWLFLSDMFYPGWKATIDGRKAEIYRANYAFRAVQVPAGESTVEWKYDPILFKIGLGISLLTFAGLVAGLWRGRRRHA